MIGSVHQVGSLSIERLSATDILVRGGEALLHWRERHRLPIPGSEHFPRSWEKTWAPGKWCRQVGDVWELRCSVGLAPRVVRDVAGENERWIEFYLGEDHRPHLAGLGLRDYQKESILSALRSGWGRISLATNAGKGAVIALLAKTVQSWGANVLILCDERSVWEALGLELERWGAVLTGVVAAGIDFPPDPGLTLAMVPTLAKRLKDDDTGRWTQFVESHEMVLLDEADKATAAGWRRILRAAKESVYRIGFSGSFPEGLYHDLVFETLMGPTLVQKKNRVMIERGISAKPTVEVYSYDARPVLERVRWPRYWGGTERRSMAYDHGIIFNEDRHRLIAELIRPDTPTAVVVNRIDHGRSLVEHIPGAVFLDGSASTEERDRVLTDFHEGRVRVIVVTKILDRGTNRLGSAADLIFASGEGSSRQTLQRIGRGLRRTGGKEFLRLVDVFDRVSGADLDVDDGTSALERSARYFRNAARKRFDLYKSEGFEVRANRHAGRGGS